MRLPPFAETVSDAELSLVRQFGRHLKVIAQGQISEAVMWLLSTLRTCAPDPSGISAAGHRPHARRCRAPSSATPGLATTLRSPSDQHVAINPHLPVSRSVARRVRGFDEDYVRSCSQMLRAHEENLTVK